MTLKTHAGDIITYQPLGDRETLQSATPEMAAIYMVRCARIAARLHWKPWPSVFTRALRHGLRGLYEDMSDTYMDEIFSEIQPLRGPDEDSFTRKELAARCIDGAGYCLAHHQAYHGGSDPILAWRGAPDWLIARCWYACEESTDHLRQLRNESIRHLIRIWRGTLNIVTNEDVTHVEAAGIAGGLTAAREAALTSHL